MSLLDDITISYEEFQQSLIDEGDNVTPILRNRELIERAVKDRYSLKSIYIYLHNKKIVSCNYRNFCRLCRSYIFNKANVKTVKNDKFNIDSIELNSSLCHVQTGTTTIKRSRRKVIKGIVQPKANSEFNPKY